jgi:hypothetical protein
MVKRRQCPAPPALRPMMDVTAAVQISLDDDGCAVSGGSTRRAHALLRQQLSNGESKQLLLGVVDLPTKMVLRRRRHYSMLRDAVAKR